VKINRPDPRELRCKLALAVKQKSGAGPHGDRRLKRKNRQSWRREHT
jgi:hypothetical protein